MSEAVHRELSFGTNINEACKQAIPRLYSARFTMRFDQETWVNPYHAPSLAGFLKNLLGHNLPPALWFHAQDDGVPRFLPGDKYEFVLYSLPNGLTALQKIINGAMANVKGSRDSRAFGPRWQCVRISDEFAPDRRVSSAHQLRPLVFEDIEAEARLWSGQNEVYLRLLSPLQLLKARESRPKKGLGRFCQDASELNGDLLLERIKQSIDGFRRRLGFDEPSPLINASLELLDSDLFWHGTQQLDKRGSQKPVYGLGGITWLRIDGRDAGQAWLWLMLGQYLGIGQRRGFGLGRYRLEGPDGERSDRSPERRASLLHPAFEQRNLDSAWRAIRGNQKRDCFERELNRLTFGLPEDADQRTELTRLAECILASQYETPRLEGVVIDKPSGGRRALAVPPLLDRVLQRAIAQMLHRVIEPVMYAHSFGYRPGRNRMQARDVIQRLVRSGYGWFFESDIDNFFDAVDPVLIYNRLMSLLPDDRVIDQIMSWISAPVEYQGHVIERGGLPQGSPLSPLLANLVLDDFDNDLVAAGFGPVRFADDFVVPCKTREQAERARAVVVGSLAEKGLTLNENQSRVARFSDGLKFLGYRFLNDLAVETRKSKSAQRPEQQFEPESWLANVPDDEPHAPIAQTAAGEAIADASIETAGEAGSAGSLLIVSEPGCVLFTRDGQLWLQHEEREARMLAPWAEIAPVLLLGYQRCTQAVLHRAMDHRIPIHFTDAFGRLKGRLQAEPDPAGRKLWLAQLNASENTDFACTVARELVAARLRHQAEVLRRRGVATSTLRNYEQQQKQAIEASSLETLRGIEGSATRSYFGAISDVLPAWVGFNGRNRRPPRDPFNALLSLGYTMLYSHTETLIQVTGMLPEHGFYHQSRGRHAALASDMMEPFRHLVEGTALAQINRRRLRESDFEPGNNNACRMSVRGRKVFLTSLARRFAGAMTNIDGISMSGHEHLYQQICRLAKSLSDDEIKFHAARLK